MTPPFPASAGGHALDTFITSTIRSCAAACSNADPMAWNTAFASPETVVLRAPISGVRPAVRRASTNS